MPKESLEEYTRKLAAAHAQAQAAGMARGQYDDGLDRFARKVGLRMRPAPYRHLGWIWVRGFAFMALIFGNWLWGGWADDLSTFRLVITTVGVAAPLAFVRVLYTKSYRRKYNLTPWNAL